MKHCYQHKKNCFPYWLLFFFAGLFSLQAASQIIISTESGTNFNGLSGVAPSNPAVAATITFVIENTNTYSVTLTEVYSFFKTTQNGTIPKLWYSQTSLSGAPVIASPEWVLIGTGSELSVPLNDYYPVITGLSFVIPAATQYRFAIESSNGISYTTASANPAPNTLTANGINLKVFDAAIDGSAVGYGGVFPAPINSPRAFTGRIVIACNLPTVPQVSPDTSICTGDSVHLNVTGGSLNSAAEWKWYAGSCGGGLVGAGTSITVAPSTTTAYYVRGEGGCTAGTLCSGVTVTVKQRPGIPTVNPITPICVNSVQELTINPIAITSDNITKSSDTISLPVPDNTANGVSTDLIMPALPAGAVLTNIEVRLNMVHTYPGDMIFNLRAPNGQIVNLYKYNGGTFTGQEGDLPNAGWFNTIISSTATTAFSTTVAPYNYGPGPYKPDLINTNVAGPAVQFPEGFAPTATSMTDLISQLNGTWTLAMADGGPGDVGTLTEWAIIFNYTISSTAYPAVWSPASTLFTDPAATILYDGTTPLFSVYAKPLVTINYIALSVNNGCSSFLPDTVTVTVNDPATIARDGNPADAEICEMGTAVFGIKTTGTMPSYQWQVNNGSDTSFVNINNNNNYSGTNEDTLTITGTPLSWNGFRYRAVVTSMEPCNIKNTSTAARLTVNPTPAVTVHASPYTKLLPGIIDTIRVSSLPFATSQTWLKNNMELTDTTKAILVSVDGLGIYKASVIDVNGCAGTSGELVISDSVSGKLFIFPNPNNGEFQVSYYSLKGNVLPRILVIYDSKGALVLNKTFSVTKPYDQMNVDLSRLAGGVYFVNLLDFNGKRLAFGKVVVK